MRTLEQADAMKLTDTRKLCIEVLCLTTMNIAQQQQQELQAQTPGRAGTGSPACVDPAQASALGDVLLQAARRHEHLPEVVAELAKFMEEKHRRMDLVGGRPMLGEGIGAGHWGGVCKGMMATYHSTPIPSRRKYGIHF